MKELYHFNGVTGEFAGTSLARKDPMDPVRYLIPANATDVPVERIAGKAALYADGAWSHVADMRGDTYWLPDGTEITVDTLDHVKPTNALGAPPPPTKADAKAKMTAWINSLTSQIQSQYPDVVQKGWDEEEAMARAFVAGTHTDQQLATLTADADSKGRTPAAHADRILANADVFRAIALKTRTLWLATDKALDDATPDQYAAVLDAAIAQAKPFADAYGLST